MLTLLCMGDSLFSFIREIQLYMFMVITIFIRCTYVFHFLYMYAKYILKNYYMHGNAKYRVSVSCFY